MINNSKPLFSIIIPTFNHGQFINKCLDSLISQTYTNWEAIVINNYSEDNTIEIVTNFHDVRIQLINFSNNGIIAKSRNVGIQNAKGDWICFLDSDDCWTPDKLELCLPYLYEYDLIYHDMFIKKDGSKKKTVLKGYALRQENHYLEMLLKGNPIINSSVVIRHEVVESVGFISEDKSLIAVEDFDYWLRISKKTVRFKHISKTLGYYWIGASSISYNEKQIIRMDALYNKHIHNIESDMISSEINKRNAYRQARIFQMLGRDNQALYKFFISARSKNLYTCLRSLLFILLIKLKLVI